ncbi:hypothetical protein SRIMM317S_01698 [Streptomyces rimosus subsp. rimosus]
MPTWRRICGTFQLESSREVLAQNVHGAMAGALLAQQQAQEGGLAGPEEPTRKTNSPRSISRETSLRAGRFCFG